ncbi:uncharacterized protein CDAR_435281 [Caerostris darwini]|uniref:Uncharacterized protein n=1 Tax=Caerostris darwini TaxID=1538125 RepID=A0AAV4SEZ5_9ARAC|nr:uncharacterized protein CDAR_435281 [Caerostris darwini]
MLHMDQGSRPDNCQLFYFLHASHEDFQINSNFRVGWMFMSLLIAAKLAGAAESKKQITSHKISSMSHIPWNMLLDPNYTSHKKNSALNHTYKHSLDTTSLDTSTLHPHHSYNVLKEPTSSVGHYATPLPTQYSPNYNTQKNQLFYPSKTKSQQIEYSQFTAPVPSRPVEQIVFPSIPSYQTMRPQIRQKQTSYPLQNSKFTGQVTRKDQKKKQTIRKPTDYFDADDNDYMDSYYEDYDFTSNNEKSAYKPPKRQSHTYYPNLKGGASYGKPSYSATSPDYYSQYPPNKHYGEPDHSYYNDDGYGIPGYPTKTDYYEPQGGYDYDPHIDEKYEGAYPYLNKKKGSKYGPLAFALGLLPLGLLLASLVPTVVTIPVTTAVATGRRRKRSVTFINPALDIISSYNMSSLEDPMCMNRIFCEVVKNGKQESSSIVQKFYYKLAYLLDEKIADFIGIKNLILAVRNNRCQEFRCNANRKSFNNIPAKTDASTEKT